MRAEVHDAICGAGTFDAFARGLARLADAGLERSARVVLSEWSAHTFVDTLRALADADIRVDEVVAADAALAERFRETSPVPIEVLPRA